MVIDTSGEWWTGSEPNDIPEYLRALTQESYSADECRASRCKCGNETFRLDVDRNEGAARRTCSACGVEHFICDSEEYWKEADPESWQCIECKGKHANICIGFSLYEGHRDIRWLYVGVRCIQCGVLGTFGDWKVGYGDSEQLMDKV
jgi:hypothetical protein